MYPTIISRALEAQGVKVDQINSCIDESAKSELIKDSDNYFNQFN
jgi:hypothetical protein